MSNRNPGRPDNLTHLDEQGNARMVDVSGKPDTVRTATAHAILRMQPQTLHAALTAGGPKGEVLGTARIAGIMAAKRTSDAIPMCHPLSLSSVEVRFETDLPPDADGNAALGITAAVRCTGPTGVEMEALHAVTVAALTVYDMLKAIEKSMRIESVRLLEKTGGKGDYSAQ